MRAYISYKVRARCTACASKMAEQHEQQEAIENGGKEEVDDNEPHSDDDEEDLQKPAWVGYFRLPKKDVQLEKPFLPTDE